MHKKFTILRTVFIISSYLKYLAARCSGRIIQCIGRSSGKSKLHFTSLINLTCLPTIAGAPSVVTVMSFLRGTSALAKGLSSAFLMSIPCVISLMVAKSNNSSLIVRSDKTYQTNMASCELSCVSIDSLRAKLNARELFNSLCNIYINLVFVLLMTEVFCS